MTQLPNIEQGANALLQKLEQDIVALDQSLTTEDGIVLAMFYCDLVTRRINKAMNVIPRWALNALPWETMEYLGNQTRKDAIKEINEDLTVRSELQTNQAIDLLLEKKWDTQEYLSLLGQIVDTRNRLLAILLMQSL